MQLNVKCAHNLNLPQGDDSHFFYRLYSSAADSLESADWVFYAFIRRVYNQASCIVSDCLLSCLLSFAKCLNIIKITENRANARLSLAASFGYAPRETLNMSLFNVWLRFICLVQCILWPVCILLVLCYVTLLCQFWCNDSVILQGFFFLPLLYVSLFDWTQTSLCSFSDW